MHWQRRRPNYRHRQGGARRHQQCCARSVTRSGTCRAAPLPLRCTRRAKGGGTRDAAEGYAREGAIAGSGPCTGACASKFRDRRENRKASHHFDSVGGSFIRSRVILGLSMYLRSRAVAAVSLSFTYSNSLAPVKKNTDKFTGSCGYQCSVPESRSALTASSFKSAGSKTTSVELVPTP